MEKTKSALTIYTLDIAVMFLAWGALYLIDNRAALTLDAKFGLLAEMILILWYLFLGLSLAAEYLLIQKLGICKYDICVVISAAVLILVFGSAFMIGNSGSILSRRADMILISCAMIGCAELFGIALRRKSVRRKSKKDTVLSGGHLQSKEI